MKTGVNPTMKDLQRVTGLGLATISKYVNGGTVRPDNKILLDRAVAKLGYQRNEYARALKTSRSKTIGVVIPELSNLFCTTIVTSVEDILRQKGYAVIICDCRSNVKLEQNAVEFLLSKQVDGILNMPVSADGRSLLPVVKQGKPVVLFDRKVDKHSYSTVLIDNRHAAALAVEHLVDCGHRRIGLIYGGDELFTFRERGLGYRDAMSAAGIEPDPSLVCAVAPTLAGGYGGMKKLLLQAPDMTAVFTVNYEMTLGAVIAANEAGIRIPDSLSFIGFDNLEFSKLITPKLTIIAQPMERIASAVTDLILAELEDDKAVRRMVVLETQLIQGSSVASI